jgi:hypothetical protein
MTRPTRLLLAAAVLAGCAATAVPASANDCSDPKQPCGGCSLNLQTDDPTRLIVCHPV